MSDKLQKLLAHAGLGSRREIETWISDGRISVNGKRAKLGDRAAADDRVLLDGKMLLLNEASDQTIKALIYHKPEGEICSRKDPKGRPTIFDNLPSIPGGRWVSVGRLDINTSGLLLLTNNGELANKLMHPSTGLEREYLVRIRGKASEETIKTLTGTGVMIDDKPARFERVIGADMADEGTNHWYRVIIREGRYREVRRMWDEVGHTVSRLKRIRYGTIKLTRDVKRGQHSKIAPMQLEKMVVSLGIEDLFTGQLYSKPSRSSGVKPGVKRKNTLRHDSASPSRRRSNDESPTAKGSRGSRGDAPKNTSRSKSSKRGPVSAKSAGSKPSSRSNAKPTRRAKK
ncbi:MAG: 23S rRNA pseudouridine2605 synthase [Dinoroseobacter sp.]|jgi:23S rRNA pseudouridine2605 synthase